MSKALKLLLLSLGIALSGSTWAGRDGSGTYTLPAGNPVQTGTTISSTWANTTLSDIAAAMSDSIAKDGQTVPTANLPMGGFRHTNVADANARNQYPGTGQVQDFDLNILSTVSGTNTVTASLSPAITSYVTGMPVILVPANNNTGATTLSINGLAARSIVKWDGDALASGDLVSGIPALLVTSGSQFVLLNPQTVNLTAAQILANLLTVDGSGSSLDADTVDGQHASAFSAASHTHPTSDITSGTLPVARGGTGVTSSTGSGSVVLSASPTLSGTITGGTFSGNGSALTSLNASNLSSGTVPSARISSASVTQHMDDGYARNITGRAGVTKTLSSSAPSGGSNGDIWYQY